MRAAFERGDPKPDWGRFDFHRWVASETYLELTPIERVIATSLYVWQAQSGPLIDEDGNLSVAGQGIDAVTIRGLLGRIGFVLVGRRWEHPLAMRFFREAVDFIASRRRGGLARASAVRGSGGLFDEHPPQLEAQHPPQHPPQLEAEVLRTVPYRSSVVTTTDSSKEERIKEETTAAREVFDYWREKTGHKRSGETPERLQHIRNRLREEPGTLAEKVAGIKLAVDGALADPLFNGSEKGVSYLGFENIFIHKGRNRIEKLQRAAASCAPKESEPDHFKPIGRGAPAPGTCIFPPPEPRREF